jgi:hypothetical protein
MTTPTSGSRIAPGATRVATKFLALEESEFLFIQKADAATALSASTARSMSELSGIVTEQSVVLLNVDEQIEASVDLYKAASLDLKNFESICAVALAPTLSRELGHWQRQSRRSDGFWDVDFKFKLTGNDAAHVAFENFILKPWFGEKKSAASYTELRKLCTSWEKRDRSLARVHAQVYETMKNYLLVEGASDAAWQDLVMETMEKLQSSDAEVLEASRRAEVDVTAEATQLVRAAESLDAMSAKFATAVEQVARRVKISDLGKSKPPSDPIQNAIEIKQQLTSEVEFVEAPKWAKWRGIKSKNPSSALGKYKKQDRVFAVSSGRKHLYPVFQFSKDAEPLPVMAEILARVPKKSQDWALLSWFSARNRLLGGQKPCDVVADDPKAVLKAADRFYSRDG